MIVFEAITNNPGLYKTAIKRSTVNGKTYGTIIAERFGAIAFDQDLSSLPQITLENKNRLINYSLEPDSNLIIR